MRLKLFTSLTSAVVLATFLAGCATSGLPSGARLVGGGMLIDYTARRDGTAILMERTSRRIVATETLSEGGTFSFYASDSKSQEALNVLFPPTVQPDGSIETHIPANAHFDLYFVPAKSR
jgi:hypothetical protein